MIGVEIKMRTGENQSICFAPKRYFGIVPPRYFATSVFEISRVDCIKRNTLIKSIQHDTKLNKKNKKKTR